MAQQQVFEARRRRGAWTVSPDVPGRARQRLSGAVGRQSPSLAQVAGRLPARVVRARESGRLSPAGVGMVAAVAAVWSVVELVVAALVQLALWSLLGESLVRAAVSWLLLAAVVVWVAW
jgi:hypothetical protein